MELPPGFRFHPTDEELITHYLSKKVLDSSFSAIAIGEVDMNKVEPWELPWKGKLGEKEWYFFCVRDKKYPTGVRTNRATSEGYWKATGKDREIFRGKTLVGMKKTLVFYKGRAPKGEKSNWVTHEYRLEGKLSLPKPVKNDWVISRVFQKNSGGKKVHIYEGNELSAASTMPPLMDIYPAESGHVHCFSNSIVAPEEIQDYFININPVFPYFQNPVNSFSRGKLPQIQDPLVFRTLLGSYGENINQGFRKGKEMISLSEETENSCVEMGKKSFQEHDYEEGPSTSVGPQDLDCIWSY